MVKQGKKQGVWVIRVHSGTAPDGHKTNPQEKIIQNEGQGKVGRPTVDEISDTADPGK